MNPELPQNPREELELRLTALLLGELSAAEAAAVREAIAKDLELAKLHDDLKEIIHLVREATTKAIEPAAGQTEPVRLSSQRREKLFAHFKTISLPKLAVQRKRRMEFTLLELAAALAIIALLAAITIPNFTKARTTAQSSSIINNLRRLDGAKQQWALENHKSANDVPTFDDIRPYLGRGGDEPPSVAGETYVLDRVSELPVAYGSGGKPGEAVRLPSEMGLADQTRRKPEAEARTLAYRTWGDNMSPSSPQIPPAQSSGGVHSVNVVGYVNTVLSNGWTVIGQPLENSTLSSSAQKERPMKGVGSTAPQIVLPITADADANVAASEELFRKNQGLGSATYFAGNPEWVGVLEKPNQPHSGNAFVGRYASVTKPGEKALDLSAGRNEWANNLNSMLADQFSPRPPVQVETEHAQKPNESFQFYSGLNRNPSSTPAPTAAGKTPAETQSQDYQVTAGSSRGFYDDLALAGGKLKVEVLNETPVETHVAGSDISPTTGLPAISPSPKGTVQLDSFSLEDGRLGLAGGRGSDGGSGGGQGGGEGSTRPAIAGNQTWAMSESGVAVTNSATFGFEVASSESLATISGRASGSSELRDSERSLYDRNTFYRQLSQLGTDSPDAERSRGRVEAGTLTVSTATKSDEATGTGRRNIVLELPRVEQTKDLSEGIDLGGKFTSGGIPVASEPEARDVDIRDNTITSNGQITQGFLGYDDPGQFAPQASVGGNVPTTSSLPVQRYRVRTQEPNPAADSAAIVLPQAQTTIQDVTLSASIDGRERELALTETSPPKRQLQKFSLNSMQGSKAWSVGARLREFYDDNYTLADAKIQETQKQVAQLRDGLAISDMDAGGPAPSPSIEAVTLRNIEVQRIESEQRLKKGQALLDNLKPLTKDELRKVLPTVVNDASLKDSLSQLNATEQKLASLQTNYSPDNLEYPRAKVQVDKLNQVINARIDGVMSSIENQIAVNKAEVEKMKGVIDEAKKLDAAKAGKSQAYYDKKRELAALQKDRQILNMKIAAERLETVLPKTSMVIIADPAQPVAPRKPSLWARISGKSSDEAEAAVRIKIEGDASDITGLSRGEDFAAYDPFFVQTEVEAIQSEAVLGKVVDLLGLDETWAKQHGVTGKLKKADAVKMLKEKIDLQPVRNTKLLEIRAKSDSPEEAAKIANAVAEAYRDYRLTERRRLTLGGIEALEGRFAEQEKQVRRAQYELERLRIELGVEPDDIAPRKATTNAPIPQPEIQTSENSFSTFSLNVSDVSFKLAAASLEKGQMPDAATVRSEEFINAFDYRDPEPVAGAPIAFAWERARYPFAHNRDLLRFSLKTAAAGRQAGRPLNIVLLLDNSGSMERADRVQIIREALRVLASQLQPHDKLSVITFSRTARLVADGIAGDKAGEVAEQVSGLTPQGGTNLEDAMNLAYQTAARHYLANGINRVVLLTDGAANLGDVEPDSLKQKVEAQRKQGIALDCFGIGWEGFNDDLLEVLSRNGDGRYGFINSPEEAATEFAGQLAGALKVAASDVKVQVEFNPKRVTTYRQIGYAKHQLTKEQFRDNTVDAAEIAAQEAGNALYTVEVNPAGEGPLCTVRVRFKIPGTTDYREQSWDVPFTGNAVSLEQSSPAMRLAASASAFSEWLIPSPFAGEVTPDRLLGYLSGVPEVFGADSRPKKLEWMIRQAKGIEGK